MRVAVKAACFLAQCAAAAARLLMACASNLQKQHCCQITSHSYLLTCLSGLLQNQTTMHKCIQLFCTAGQSGQEQLLVVAHLVPQLHTLQLLISFACMC